jgi:hypothetical protein
MLCRKIKKKDLTLNIIGFKDDVKIVKF